MTMSLVMMTIVMVIMIPAIILNENFKLRYKSFSVTVERRKNSFIETKLIIMVIWSFVLYDSLVNITVKVT